MVRAPLCGLIRLDQPCMQRLGITEHASRYVNSMLQQLGKLIAVFVMRSAILRSQTGKL